jgi:hypothetical protein
VSGQSILTYSLAAVVYASRPLGRYTSLIFSSYTSYRLNSGSSLTSFTAPSRAQKAFGGFRERHTSEPSLATYTSTMYGWRMLIGLCFIASTIHGNLRSVSAISINLSLRSSHFFIQSTPNVYSKDFLKRIAVFKAAHGDVA